MMQFVRHDPVHTRYACAFRRILCEGGGMCIMQHIPVEKEGGIASTIYLYSIFRVKLQVHGLV